MNIYRARKNDLQNIDKNDPGRAKQNSTGTTGRIVTKPRTSHFFGLCTNELIEILQVNSLLINVAIASSPVVSHIKCYVGECYIKCNIFWFHRYEKRNILKNVTFNKPFCKVTFYRRDHRAILASYPWACYPKCSNIILQITGAMVEHHAICMQDMASLARRTHALALRRSSNLSTTAIQVTWN